MKKSLSSHFLILLMSICTLFFYSPAVIGQEGPVIERETSDDEQEEIDQDVLDDMNTITALQNPKTDPKDMTSLLFNRGEYRLLKEARAGQTSRMPTIEEIEEALPSEERLVNPGPRELFLSGIAYVSAKDWTVWLNGTRIKPGALPEEIVDINVYKGFVEIKWFDEFTNKIFPVRLRPHQRFNLDTRIFVPG